MPWPSTFARFLSRNSYSVTLMIFCLFRRKQLMTDLGAIAIVLACFTILFAILHALDRI
jgi:hypothetical protein